MKHPLADRIIAAYIRVSKDIQDVELQRKSIIQWAKRHGVVIAHWFSDDKGKNPRDKADKRIHFQRLLRFVGTDACDAVIVDKQDRFGTKDAHEWGKFITELREHGCELWSVAQGNLSADDDGTVLSGTLGAMTSRREQKEKGLRSLQGKIAAVKAGKYAGGYPPFGCDVVCYAADGSEKWRLVYVGQFRRIKITPNGKQQEYNGKNNVPGRDKEDIPRLQPSVRKERLKVVRQIFNWYASENISPGQIAARLRDAGVDAVYSMQWEKMRVKSILANPAFIGMPTSNKRASGRFWEYVNGEMREVKEVKGKVKTARPRKKEDYIFPEKQVFKPIIPIDLFNKVQAKLQKATAEFEQKKPRSPRVASFWLRNIVYCAKCKRPMRCWNDPSGKRPYRTYMCPIYGTYGIKNPTDCRSHRVKADLLETLVETYLGETNERIARLLSRKPNDPLEAMDFGVHDKSAEFIAVLDRMTRFLDRHQPKHFPPSLVKAVQGRVGALQELMLYDYVFDKRRPELEKEYKKLNAVHDGLVKRFLELPDGATAAREKIKQKMLDIEPQLNEMKAELENLSGRFQELVMELNARMQAILAVKKRVSTDAEYRRKTELVKTVIERADCHFVPIKGTGKTRRSEFVFMDIIPASGDARRILPDGTLPGTISFWMGLFSRRFSTEEIAAVRSMLKPPSYRKNGRFAKRK